MKRFYTLLLALIYSSVFASASAQGTYSSVYHFNVPSGGYDGAGKLLQYSDSANGSWTLSYDTLNRLLAASATSGPYNSLGLGFTYDSFGNRLSQSVTGTPAAGTVQSHWATYDSANRITTNEQLTGGGIQYDAAGNMTFNGSLYLAYDDDGNVCATQSSVLGGNATQYLYDAEGRRVAKGHSASNATALACTDGGSDFVPDATYALGAAGEQVTEVDGTGAWKHTNVYAAGQLIATYDTSGRGLHFYLDDPLGSRRVQVSPLGEVELNCTNLPFGDNVQGATSPCQSSGTDSYGHTYLQGATDPTEHHFTGKERDTESGLDYFGARYYASAMGRFISPDWAAKAEPVPYAVLDDPQSLNLYGYVRNNPLSRVDKDGHCCSWGDVAQFTAGAMNAYTNDTSMGMIHTQAPTTFAAGLGAMVGHAIVAIQSIQEASGGMAAFSGGVAACSTGFGCAAGAPAIALGAGATAHAVAAGGTAVLAMGKLAQSKTGPGSVPPGERAAQRTATPGEKSQKLGEQGGKCANCEKPLKEGDGVGHHYPDRHADGGKDVVVVCKECHKELHSGSN